MQVFVCMKGKEYLATFATRELAEQSWRITESKSIYSLRFRDIHSRRINVESESAGFGWVVIGYILMEDVRDLPDHL